MTFTPDWVCWQEDPRVRFRRLDDQVTRLAIGPLYRLEGHTEQSFHVLMVEQGSMVQRVGSRTIDLSAGSVRLSAPGEPQRVTYGEKGARCLSLHLDPAMCPEGLREIQINSGLAWRRLARTVMASVFSGSPLDGDELCISLDELRAPSPGRRQRRAPWIETVRDQLAEESHRPPGLADIARRAGRSRSQVARAFKDAFGCTPGQYARRRRAERAVALIRRGVSLSDAAIATGFADQSHMHRAVVAHTGQTPASLARA